MVLKHICNCCSFQCGEVFSVACKINNVAIIIIEPYLLMNYMLKSSENCSTQPNLCIHICGISFQRARQWNYWNRPPTCLPWWNNSTFQYSRNNFMRISYSISANRRYNLQTIRCYCNGFTHRLHICKLSRK